MGLVFDRLCLWVSPNRRVGDDFMQLTDGFFDSFFGQLIGRQPANATLADIDNGKNIFAQRLQHTVKVSFCRSARVVLRSMQRASGTFSAGGSSCCLV